MLTRAMAWLIVILSTISAARAVTGQSFSVGDSIEMTRFNSPDGRVSYSEANRSPDGRYVLIVTSKGIISTNKIESDIWLYNSKELTEFVTASTASVPPAGRCLARLRGLPSVREAGAYKGVISELKWSLDSKTVYFLLSTDHAEQQLFSVDVDGKSLSRLSLPNQDVQHYDISQGEVVYTVTLSSGTVRTTGSAKIASIVITGLRLEDVLAPQRRYIPHEHQLWVRRGTQLPNRVRGATTLALDAALQRLSLSPNGRFLAELIPITKSPPSDWASYEPSSQEPDWRIDPSDPLVISPNNIIGLKSYAVVNLETGHTTTVDAPMAASLGYLDAPTVTWSPDSKSLLFTNSFLPLSAYRSGNGSEFASAKYPCTAATLDVATSRIDCISWNRYKFGPPPFQLQDALFERTDDNVVLHFTDLLHVVRTEHYHFDGKEWNPDKISTEDATTSNGTIQNTSLSVYVREGLNEAPCLWVRDRTTGKSKRLWDPNPQFAHLALGETTVYHWKDETGYEWTGGLVKPVGYQAGRRYPLVIQTHGFQTSEFITDGQFPTAMAARPLASAGIMVLQVGTHSEHIRQYQEVVDQLSGYRAAIDKLNADGLIDPSRVGIVGFSRSAWYVEQALISYPELFKAATIADGVDESYLQYLTEAPEYPLLAKDYEAIIGSKPFGSGLERWVKLAAGFHTDQVITPLRIEAIGSASSVLQEWEIYASLRLQDKPVDFVYLPHGEHILQAPSDRLASQQGNVDWFRFWLQGYERPNPGDQDQYKRWEHLRQLRDEEVRNPGQASSIH